jgi:transcriptional regulator with XRE-family HTH domain
MFLSNIIGYPKYSEFLSIALSVKKNVSQLQLKAGYSMNEGARLLDVSQKQLEDIETVRNYGCHLDLELLAKIKAVYKTSMDELIG